MHTLRRDNSTRCSRRACRGVVLDSRTPPSPASLPPHTLPARQIDDLLLLLPDTLSLSRFKQQIEVSFERYHRNLDESKQQLLDLEAVQRRVRNNLMRAKLQDGQDGSESAGERAGERARGAAASAAGGNQSASTRRSATKTVAVHDNRVCDLSGRPLLTGSAAAATALEHQCYVFPCQHCFRSDALIGYVASLVSPERRKALGEVHQSIAALSKAEPGAGAPSDASERQHAELSSLRLKMDEAVAAECPLCGDLAVQALTTPFASAHAVAAWDL